ncbi:MAG: hypothetical protein NT167_28695, partial [Verrucomicrobia bacterium]|nr:hypothetical protein [Verrucomicrobiota bacterium]
MPSLLTLLFLLWEISWAYPTNRNDNAKADVAALITTMRFIIICFMVVILSFARATILPLLPGSAHSALSGHLRTLYKSFAINRLRANADKAREWRWRVGANLLKSDGVLADMQNAMGRSAR